MPAHYHNIFIMHLFILIITFLFLSVPAVKISDTSSLIEVMQKKYTGKWATSVTFVQHNVHYQADTVHSKSVWYEAIKYPDKFRIDFGALKEGNAVIFASDSVYSFKGGQLKARKKQANHLMLLAGGIYFMPTDEALKRITEAGYNLHEFHEDTWQGKQVYVVGAQKGDLQSAQFWIDKEKLIVVRTITLTPNKHIQEARFSKHIKTAGGWTETEVLFLKDGKPEQLEEYKNIRINASLPAGLFDASQFGKVHWLPDQK